MYDVLSIRRANPIEEVIASSGVELRLVGRRLVGVCPFHRDGRPSLVVYPQNESYFCFGCGAGGDVIDFVARLNGVGFREAAAMLSTPSTQHEDRRSQGRTLVSFTSWGEDEPLPESEATVVEAAVAFYHDALWRSREALTYLADRGIDQDTARRCRLGFGRPGLAELLRRRRLSLAAAHRVGLLAGDAEMMLGRIVVPDLRGGRATWLTSRALRQGPPRYLNLRLAKPLLGLGLVHGDDVLVTEGPFDVRFVSPKLAASTATRGGELGRDIPALDNLRSDVGCGSPSQFPTAEVNSEMRLPHGSDWSSIREAGRETEHRRNPTGRFSGAGSYGQRKQTSGDPSLDLPSLRGLLACPKRERLGAGGSRTDRYSLPLNPVERTALRLRKTDLRNEVTTPHSPCGRSRSKRQLNVRGTVGLSKKQMPRVMPGIC